MALSPQDQAGLAQFLHSLQGSPLHEPLPSGTAPDTSYLTFLRSMGFSEQQAYQQAAAQIDRARRQITMNVGDIQDTGVETRKGINENFESRGIFRGGERLRDLARQRSLETKQIGNAQTTGADVVGGIRTALSGQLSDLARQRAEQVLNLQQRNETRRLITSNPNSGLSWPT